MYVTSNVIVDTNSQSPLSVVFYWSEVFHVRKLGCFPRNIARRKRYVIDASFSTEGVASLIFVKNGMKQFSESSEKFMSTREILQRCNKNTYRKC